MAAICAAFLAGPVPAAAQAYACRVPERIDLPAPVRPDGPAVRAPITGYTLAISWSPEYCRGGKRRANDYQCDGTIGRFGFVLHGLWGEARGRAPQWCALTPRPSADELRANLCMTPLPWLLEHEWAKHGSCLAKTPAAYFAKERALWQALALPDADRLSRQPGLTAGDLRAAFAALNPAIPMRAIGILASGGGWLREIRICYDAALRPQTCSNAAYGPRSAVPLRIWRGL